MANVPVKSEKSVAQLRPATMPSWDKFREEMDKVFDRFSTAFDFPALKPIHEVGNFWPSAVTGLAGMAVDVTEDDKSYRIAAELPGLDEKDVDVTVNDDAIILKGEKSQEKEEKNKDHYYSERSYGVFRRSFALPKNVDRKAIGATFAKGVLTVTIPKTAAAQTQQKIDVKAA